MFQEVEPLITVNAIYSDILDARNTDRRRKRCSLEYFLNI